MIGLTPDEARSCLNKMIAVLKKILKPKYEPFNHLEIKADYLLHNWQYLKSLQPEAMLFPVLKSNAYGHGLAQVCQILNRTDAKMVAVDSYPEAQIVYRNFSGQVLILSEMPVNVYQYAKLSRTEFIIYNENTLRHIARFGRRARVHLFYNTGMNREGIQDLESFLKRNKKYLDRVEITGFCSHLASADQESTLNAQQEGKFLKGLSILRRAGYSPGHIHLGNSAGLFKLHNSALTAFRPGLSFYGYSPFSQDNALTRPLRPALELYSKIINLEEISTGQTVSYNEDFKADKELTIGLMPFGYYEGLDRRLSNQAKVLILSGKNSFFAPVAGRICMNLTCLNLGENKANIGDKVQIISSDILAKNSLSSLAIKANTIIYDLLVGLEANIRREVV